MIRTRIALFALELNMETSRLLGLFALGSAVLVFGLLAVLMFSLFMVTIFWDTPHRMLAIGLLGGMYALAAILILIILCRRIKKVRCHFKLPCKNLSATHICLRV